jgi:amidase
MALTPRPLGWFDAEDGERNFMQQCQYTPFTSYVNVAGLPAMSLPVTAEPLPMGVHVIGRPGDELTLLRLARDLEREFEWNRRAPAWALGDSATSRR